MQKTLGGDRLGSGNKQKVNLHGYERSTHDIGYVFRSTMSAGTLIPFIKEIALPGDTFDINLNADVKTHPTVGPLFGSYKLQLDVFQCPIRLYHAWLHNNRVDIGRNMANVKFPLVEMKARNNYGIDFTGGTTGQFDLDNYQINPSCIFSYLGIRGVGSYSDINPTQGTRRFNALPWLMYWDIVKNYYTNKQEEIAAVIHTGRDPVDHNTTDISLDLNSITHGITPGIGQLLVNNTGQQFILTTAGTPQRAEDILLFIEDNSQPNVGRWVPLLSIATWQYDAAGTQVYIYNNSLINGMVFLWAYTDEAGSPEIKVHTFPLSYLDDIRDDILLHAVYPAPFVLSDISREPFNLPLLEPVALKGMYALDSQEGLALKTYQSDLLNNWISKDWIDGAGGISELTAIDTTGGSFTLDTLLISRKVYDVLNRVAISGGTAEDWQEAVYDHQGFTKAYSPIYQGGLSKELIFQEVVSNAATDTLSNQPLGTLAGKGVMSHKHKGGKITIKVDEPSYIIALVSLTPRIDYSQGNDWDIHLETMDDLHKPGMDEIGFQELITEQMAWWDTNYQLVGGQWIQKSAGKQPAWINYMTNINRVRGNFAIQNNEMFMTLNRRYASVERDPILDPTIDIKDLTTYIDPSIYNQIFAETALDSQNFWTQIAVDMTVRRKISAKLMPNL